MCHNEVACITAGAAKFSRILDEADAIASAGIVLETPGDALGEALPVMLAQLSPEARAEVREYQHHCVELIAGLHNALRG